MKIKKLPTDNPSNFYLEDAEVKEHLLNWIKDNLVERGGTWRGSYELQDIYGSMTGRYVSNGTMKEAMKLSGFKVQDEKSSKNWGFKISKRSPAIRKFYNLDKKV